MPLSTMYFMMEGSFYAVTDLLENAGFEGKSNFFEYSLSSLPNSFSISPKNNGSPLSSKSMSLDERIYASSFLAFSYIFTSYLLMFDFNFDSNNPFDYV